MFAIQLSLPIRSPRSTRLPPSESWFICGYKLAPAGFFCVPELETQAPLQTLSLSPNDISLGTLEVVKDMCFTRWDYKWENYGETWENNGGTLDWIIALHMMGLSV